MASARFPNPNLRIRPATPADVPDLVRVHFDAFNPDVMNRLMHPGGGSAEARVLFGKKTFFPAPAAQEDVPQVEFITMVAELIDDDDDEEDDDDGTTNKAEIVAFAKWKLVKEPGLSEEKWNVEEKPMTAKMLGEGADADVFNTFIGGLHRLTRKWVKGDPILYLSLAACSPKHQRLGAGTALLTWGNELADREGKVQWLEASPAGYPLYKRMGFEDVDGQDLGVTELWGAVKGQHDNWGSNSAVELLGELPEGCFRSVLMRRFPRMIS
ncbi:unnamed protein product [Discula destructiva]